VSQPCRFIAEPVSANSFGVILDEAAFIEAAENPIVDQICSFSMAGLRSFISRWICAGR
jgi:hypothetical protein